MTLFVSPIPLYNTPPGWREREIGRTQVHWRERKREEEREGRRRPPTTDNPDLSKVLFQTESR